MKIYEVEERTQQLVTKLLNIWETSVRATHYFLSDAEVEKIKEYVPQALNGVAHLIVAENESAEPVAFMGMKMRVWKCFSFHRQKEEKDLAGS